MKLFARITGWLAAHLLPGDDPVAEADARLWEEHREMLPEGSKLDNGAGVPMVSDV